MSPRRIRRPGAKPFQRENMRTVIRHQNLFMSGIAAAVLGGWLIFLP